MPENSNNLTCSKQPWVTPRLLERTSIASARSRKSINVIETTLTIGGIAVAVGPSS